MSDTVNLNVELMKDYGQYQWGLAYPIVALVMLFFYIIFLIIKNPGLVDFAWESSHLAVGILHYVLNCIGDNRRSITFFALLFLWWLRLGGYILVTRIIPGEKDPRYEKLAEEKNPYVFFFIQYQFQGFLVAICSAPLFFVFQQSIADEITWSYWVGIILVVVGIVFEAIADYQLYGYKQRMKKDKAKLDQGILPSVSLMNDTKKKIFQEGLWKKSRHPNLFFEQVIWFGFAFAGIGQQPAAIFGFIGPILLYLIMRFLTVPITEAHMRSTRPEYEEFCKQTNMFFIF